MKSELENIEKLFFGFLAGVVVTLLVVGFFDILSKVTEKESESELAYSACSRLYGELVQLDDGLYYDDVTGIVYFWDGKSPRHEATPCYAYNGLPYKRYSYDGRIVPAPLDGDVERVIREIMLEEKERQEEVLK